MGRRLRLTALLFVVAGSLLAQDNENLIRLRQQRIAVEEQRVTQIVDEAVRQARRSLPAPEAAKALKRTLEAVLANNDLGPAVKDKLVNHLETTLRAIAQEAPAASQPPEALLAPDSLVYFRFDGLEPHRKAYEQTALAEVMKGDLGDFLQALTRLVQEALGPGVVKEKLLAGLPPEQVIKISKAAGQLPRLVAYLQQHGVVFGLEVVEVLPPRVVATLVFPQGGDPRHREPLFAALQLLTELNHLKVEQATLEGRTVFHVKFGGATLAWWQEGEHFVCTYGTEEASHTLNRLKDKDRAGLAGNPLFKQVAGFNRYETLARGFIDLDQVVQRARKFGPPAEKVIDEFGLAGMKSVTAHVGFNGKYQQASIALNLAGGERKGLLRLASAQKGLDLDQLPPLPPDANTVTIARLDAVTLYDLIRQGTEIVTAAVSPPDASKVKEAFANFDKALGIELRKELLEDLDSPAVFYNSPGEGPFFFGLGMAIKVKDAEKVRKALDTLTRSLANDANARIRKSRYQNVDMYIVSGPEGRGLPILPSYAVHGDWLVAGLNPQTVKGHILRNGGKFTAWKPAQATRDMVAELKKDPRVKVLAVNESDPRPPLKQLASFGQILVLALSFNPSYDANFDPGMVPHFQSITEALFANVSVLVDDGDSIRLESRGSLALPFDFLGIDSSFMLYLVGASF